VEWKALERERFQWILPRARSAGFRPTQHTFMREMGAAGLRPNPSDPPSAVPEVRGGGGGAGAVQLLLAWRGAGCGAGAAAWWLCRPGLRRAVRGGACAVLFKSWPTVCPCDILAATT